MKIPIWSRGYDDEQTKRLDLDKADARKDLVTSVIMQNETYKSLKSDQLDWLVERAIAILSEYLKKNDYISIEFAAWMAGFELDLPEHLGIIAGAEHYLYDLEQ